MVFDHAGSLYQCARYGKGQASTSVGLGTFTLQAATLAGRAGHCTAAGLVSGPRTAEHMKNV